jgi:hypothetical protein
VDARFNKAEAGRKIRLSLSLGVIAAVLVGGGRVAWFLIDEQYSMAEGRGLLPEFLVSQLNSALFISNVASNIWMI